MTVFSKYYTLYDKPWQCNAYVIISPFSIRYFFFSDVFCVCFLEQNTFINNTERDHVLSVVRSVIPTRNWWGKHVKETQETRNLLNIPLQFFGLYKMCHFSCLPIINNNRKNHLLFLCLCYCIEVFFSHRMTVSFTWRKKERQRLY